MRSIRPITVKRLNSEVQLVGTCDFSQTQWRRKHFTFAYASKEGGYSNAYDLRFDRLYNLPGRLFESITEVDGQPVFVWTNIDAWVDTWQTVYEERNNYVQFISQIFKTSHGGFFANINGEGFRDKLIQLRKESKVNKYGHATVANTIRALCTIYGFTNAEDVIKNVMTMIKSGKRPLYLYATTDYIENHYDQLRETQNLNSCMTKGTESLDADHHYIKVDKAKANAQGYRTRTTNNEPSVFMPNIATLNNTDKVALGLTSFYSPEELQELDEYGFNGRCVMVERDGKWTYTRYYGHEGVKDTISSLIERVNTFKGLRLKGYVSAVTGREEHKDAHNLTYILPYVDGDDNLFKRVGDRQEDEIGRPFYWFEVVEGNRRNSDVPNYKKGNYFFLDQSNWYVEPFRYETKCAITGETVTHQTGWLVAEGVHIRYDLVPTFNTTLEVMGRDVHKTIGFMHGLLSPVTSRLTKLVEEYKETVDSQAERLRDVESRLSTERDKGRMFDRFQRDVKLHLEDWYFNATTSKARRSIDALASWLERTLLNDKPMWRKYGYTFAMVWNGTCKTLTHSDDKSAIHTLLSRTIETVQVIFENVLFLADDTEYKRIRQLINQFSADFERDAPIRPTTETDKPQHNNVVTDKPGSIATLSWSKNDLDTQTLIQQAVESFLADRFNRE